MAWEDDGSGGLGLDDGFGGGLEEGLEEAAPVAKKPRLGGLNAESDMCVKLLVNPNAAGKIIGRQGCEIKALRDQLGVGLHIHGQDNVFPKAPNQQIAVLFGGREMIDIAFGTVIAKIVEAEPVPPAGDAAPIRVSMLITQNAVSAIIGNKGATVKQLREESGCNISADSQHVMGEQLVHVTGTSDRLPYALSLITPIIEKSADSLQVAEQRYGMAGGKGMYGDSFGKGGGKGWTLPGQTLLSAGAGAGKGGGKGKAPIQAIGSAIGAGSSKGKQAIGSAIGASSVHMSKGKQQQVFAGDPEEDPAVMESQSSIQFSIPKETIGRVLGKAGASAAEIRRLTGAALKIDPREEDGLVTLTGSLYSVHKAHCMVVGRVLSPY